MYDSRPCTDIRKLASFAPKAMINYQHWRDYLIGKSAFVKTADAHNQPPDIDDE
jgi:hypothetical protein